MSTTGELIETFERVLRQAVWLAGWHAAYSDEYPADEGQKRVLAVADLHVQDLLRLKELALEDPDGPTCAD